MPRPNNLRNNRRLLNGAVIVSVIADIPFMALFPLLVEYFPRHAKRHAWHVTSGPTDLPQCAAFGFIFDNGRLPCVGTELTKTEPT